MGGDMSLNVAVVGAGIAGLRAAALLAPHARVVVFEKSRGFGGRLATRRAGVFSFDHGAPYFRARDPEFVTYVADLAARGIVAPWRARFAEIDGTQIDLRATWDEAVAHYVGVPGMSAVGRHMAQGLDVRLETRIVATHADGAGWRLESEGGERRGPFDALVLALPAPQALALLPPDSPLTDSARAARMQGCFALMLGYERALATPFDAALVRGSPLSWISVGQSKPGRDAAPALVALSANEWADAHIEDDPEAVRETLLAALASVLSEGVRAASHSALHCWRYANAGRARAPLAALDAPRRLAVCGDWLVQGRVETAFLSGSVAARDVLGALGR
jgi:renalase